MQPLYSEFMDIDTGIQIPDLHLDTLEARLDELIGACGQMARTIRALEQQQAELVAERDALIRQNAQTRSRIEAMVARLRGLEIADER